MLILDIETYVNYFLIVFKNTETKEYSYFESWPDKPLDGFAVKYLMENHTTISFNGLSYDLPVLQAALEGFSNQSLKSFSDKIIKSKDPSWAVCKTNEIRVPLDKWDHIDLIEVAPGKGSLKLYGGRLHAPKIQDLPIGPDQKITGLDADFIRLYCMNDVDTTELLYEALRPQLALRESMSKQYGLDLRSKSDAQIAEAVIKSELEKITKKKYTKPKEKKKQGVQYQDPKIVTFQTPFLQDIFQKILTHEFEFMPNGNIRLPEWLVEPITIGDAAYNMGVGGLHSCEKGQFIEAKEHEILLEQDVASYYPSIILQQQLAPKSMGQDFLKLYQSIVVRRLKAKASKDMVTANTLKICLNGSFGKLGSKYSALYAPELLLQTTITGQLCLLMLIERMEAAGIRIVSANTDGIVCHTKKENERTLERVAWNWMLDTSFELERTDYRLLASRDVNNYCAIKQDGKVKGKGIFANTGLMKNPDRNIVYTAVMKFLKDGAPIKQTVMECKDVTQFVSVRKVTGGAVWNGEYLGKTVRFYVSKDSLFQDPHIHYALNGNKVPRSGGCRPLMDFGDELPKDLHFDVYVSDAKKLLKEVGYA